eukprot:NODE_2775_length_1122_cov_59.442684_g2548_i0.p2 GENE.NODE_2775_length_1122_cov_59.442684_g2548_i0~~NODE_2775_length_1122_cov_59.442684_g2548_i0.p2  ORF type:complete len:293 (-),score=32.35 NODE_2775_length_1122_cov_59.442684_g2548_i0:163-1041(-)
MSTAFEKWHKEMKKAELIDPFRNVSLPSSYGHFPLYDQTTNRPTHILPIHFEEMSNVKPSRYWPALAPPPDQSFGGRFQSLLQATDSAHSVVPVTQIIPPAPYRTVEVASDMEDEESLSLQRQPRSVIAPQKRWQKKSEERATKGKGKGKGRRGQSPATARPSYSVYDALYPNVTSRRGAEQVPRPPQGYAQPQMHAPQGYAPQSYAPQGFAPQDFAPQGFAPQGFAPQGYAPQSYAPQGFAPQDFAPQGFAPQGFAPQGFAPQGYAPQPVAYPPHAAPGFIPQPYAMGSGF